MKKVKFGRFLAFAISILYFLIVSLNSIFYESKLHEILSTRMFLAQFLAFPVLFGSVIAILSAVFLFIILKKNGIKKSFTNLGFLACLIFLISSTLFIFAGSSGGKTDENVVHGKTVNIIEWNLANQFTEGIARTTFVEYDADIAVFPELEGFGKGESPVSRMQDVFTEIGVDINQYDIFTSDVTEGNIAPVTVVVKKAFAGYAYTKHTPMTFYGTVYLEDGPEELPEIVALHTSPPLPGAMDLWRYDLDYICNEIVKEYPNAIIVGDFNATLKHGPISQMDTHEDALSFLSVFERGTWPARFPSYFRSSIDHILLPKGEYCVLDVKIIGSSESDHCAIFAQIGKSQ